MTAPPRQPQKAAISDAVGRWRSAMLYAGPPLAITLVLLLLWGFVAWFIWVYPRELLAVQQRDLSITSRAAAAQAGTVLREAETAARMVALRLISGPLRDPEGKVTLNEFAQVLNATSHGLVEVTLVKRNGDVIRAGETPGQLRSNIKDLPFFRALALGEAGTVDAHYGRQIKAPLHIDPPLALRPGEAAKLPLVMKLQQPLGELALVMALVSLESFDDLRQNFSHSPSGAVMLMRADGIGLARTPAIEGFAGRSLFAGNPERYRDFEPDEGEFTTTGAMTDGRPRMGAFVTMKGFGLKLGVSVAQEDTLAAHFRERRFLLMLITIVSLSALVTAIVLARSQRRTLLYDAELRAASDAVPLGLFRCDLQGRVTYANETYLRLLGLQREDQEWGWLALIPAADRERMRTVWLGSMGLDKPATYLQRIGRDSEAARRLVSVRTAPLIVQGRVVGQAGTLADITERALQQKAHATLTAIFDLTPDYVCQMNLQGRLLYLNPSARMRLGIAPGEALASRSYLDYYSPARAARFQNEILPTAMRDGHWHGRSGVRDPMTDVEVPVESTVLVHRDAQGTVETISVILRDISAELQALRDGRRFEAMLLSVAQTAPVMIAVLDPQQRYLFFNDAYARHVSARRDVWIGRHVRDLIGDVDYHGCQPLIEAALRGEPSAIEKRFDEGDGRLQIIEVQYAPLLPDGGEIEGVISTSRDVTQARLEEKRLREASQTDPLTQLLNRAGFAQGCERLVAAAHDRGSALCLLYMDLDKFKPVNDEYGHPVGDALLKAVAGRLRHALRPQDLLARLGGDEFAVLLPALARPADAQTVAAKLVQLIGTPFRIEQLTLNIGVSIGYCVAVGLQTDIDAMVALADAKLYEAKRGGRGRFQGEVLGAA